MRKYKGYKKKERKKCDICHRRKKNTFPVQINDLEKHLQVCRGCYDEDINQNYN